LAVAPIKKKGVCVRIKVTSNNIFCTFWSINGSKTIKVCSAGMKKVSISKKRLFFGAKIVIQSFINDLKVWKKNHSSKNTLFFYSLQAPTKIRNFIIRNIIKHATNINVEYSKPFNGCTARKKRRKKRLRFRSFK
jgi:ribosomal protein S11